ncbi:MAG: hypothetical protein AAF917_06590 [Pseudomonadota bacterium]
MNARRITSTGCILVAVSLLGACAGPGATQTAESAALPQRADGVENISISRDHPENGIAATLSVTVNGETIGELRRGDSMNFGLEAGEYDVGLTCYVTNSYGSRGDAQVRNVTLPVSVAEEAVEIRASRHLQCSRPVETTTVVNRRLDRSGMLDRGREIEDTNNH